MKKSTVFFLALLTLGLSIAFIAPPRDWGNDSQFFQGKVGVGRNPDATTNKFYVLGTTTNPGTVISDDDGGTIATITDTTIVLDADEGVKINGARFTQLIGDTVASANNLVLGYDGSMFPVSGTTTVNGISGTDWPEGAEITLIALAAFTIADSASVTAPYLQFYNDSSANVTMGPGDFVKYTKFASKWRQSGRQTKLTL